MRYTLWSHGRLVGYTDLDVRTITPTMRQGFVEPSAEGKTILADATGVWRAIAEVKRAVRARGERIASDDALVLDAMQRREQLDLELRDESGTIFDCDFIRITDLFDLNGGVVDEMCDTDEELEAEFQIRLSALSADARDQALAQRAEQDAEIEAGVAEFLEDRDEARQFGSAWPPPAEDPRWDTAQYLMQMHLKAEQWDDLGFDG